ncbi:MAG: hypothetical protein KGO96_13185 [Elusimicrobia bacterium]|nr:hypothetical protein [Elusimicrobiota bacterium]
MTECLVCSLSYLYQAECPNCRARRESEITLSVARRGGRGGLEETSAAHFSAAMQSTPSIAPGPGARLEVLA